MVYGHFQCFIAFRRSVFFASFPCCVTIDILPSACTGDAVAAAAIGIAVAVTV